MEFLPGSVVGEVLITYFDDTPFGEIVSGEIKLDSSVEWAPFGQTDLDFYAVALHEIGHVIGLDHVNDLSEIMNSSVAASDLGDGDILGAQVLYGDEEGATVPPAEEDPVAASGGGLGFGLIAVLLGAIAALLGLGPGGLFAAAALKSGDDDDPDEAGASEEDLLLTDMMPSTGVLSEFDHVDSEIDDDESDQPQDILTLV